MQNDLVEAVRDGMISTLILTRKHLTVDDVDDLARAAIQTTADRIEALSAENERLRDALAQIARLRTDLSGDFSLGSKQSDIARAALEPTK